MQKILKSSCKILENKNKIKPCLVLLCVQSLKMICIISRVQFHLSSPNTILSTGEKILINNPNCDKQLLVTLIRKLILFQCFVKLQLQNEKSSFYYELNAQVSLIYIILLSIMLCCNLYFHHITNIITFSFLTHSWFLDAQKSRFRSPKK